MGSSNETSHFGPVINPWRSKTSPDDDLVPGGSLEVLQQQWQRGHVLHQWELILVAQLDSQQVYVE